MYSRSHLFGTQLFLQLLLTAIVYWFSFDTHFQAIFCGALLCIVGIPHGSNDHLYRSDRSMMGMVKFLGVYLGTILLYWGLWWLMPLLALILFFVFSFHHFGQSNFGNDSVTYLPSWLWGIWILAFPVLLHLKEAVGIFELMLSSGGSSVSEGFLQQFIIPEANARWVMVILGTAYLISVFVFERQNFMQYLAQFIVITLWYLFTPLLTGFIIVFCLWHSLQSISLQAIYFKQSGRGTLLEFFRAMIPFSLLAILSFSVYVYVRGFQIAEAFILLSLISLPHLAVMHRLYHDAKERALETS